MVEYLPILVEGQTQVYIPIKHERYVVKVYVLYESDTGYLSIFVVYTGEDMSYPEPGIVIPKPVNTNIIVIPKPVNTNGNPSKAVLSILECLYGQGYQLALDNLYTSSGLLHEKILRLIRSSVICWFTLPSAAVRTFLIFFLNAYNFCLS